jgi:biopolymer transport protein ExbB
MKISVARIWPVVALTLAASAAPVKAQDPTVLRAALPRDLSPWGMFLTANQVVQAVIVGLLIASVITWTVGLAKAIELAALKRKLRGALSVLDRSRSSAEAERALGAGSPAMDLVRAAIAEETLSADGSAEGIKERVASRLERIEAAAGRRMGRGIGTLATIGATAPFVGLFGTVWGIMDSFVGISRAQTTNLAVVAPGIAEALLATAIGLIAVHLQYVFAGDIRVPGDHRRRCRRGAAAGLARPRPRHGSVNPPRSGVMAWPFVWIMGRTIWPRCTRSTSPRSST